MFELKVIPFKFCNMPATFQVLMDTILTGLQWMNCLIYVDDVIILRRTFGKYLTNLKSDFKQFHEAGLKYKPLKCTVCQPQVIFLGHISANEIATEAVKTVKVDFWLVLKS